MKKFKFTLFSLLVIIFSGLLIQRFSGYFYTTPVGIVKSVKIIDSEQLLTVKLVNNTKKTVVVKVKFNGNESTNPVFNKNNQILLDNSTKKWEFISLKRDGYTFILVVSFISLVLGIAGKKGFFSLVGILFNIIFLFFLLWINQRNRSINLLLLISIYTIIAIIISTGTLYGLKKIDLRKVLATIFSVFLSYFITTITMKLLNDQGLRYEEIQFLTRPYRTVFLASLMLGGIGAALDNVVVIISSLDELVRHTPEINTKELIESGKNIASDTTTSMINVLLFAYLSSATPFFIFYLANGWDFVETFKMHLSLEIMRVLCGGLAILFTIPSSFLFFLLFKKLKKKGKTDECR